MDNNQHEGTYSQNLPLAYQCNGTVDVIKSETILKGSVHKKIEDTANLTGSDLYRMEYGEKIGYVMMDEYATLDIDTEFDFEMVEFLYPIWQKKINEIRTNISK